MDSLIAAAARALAVGDVLGALKHVGVRDDPPALALRGIAMARLGELPRSRELLRRAARAFGSREALARARCVVAEAEVALAMRDLGASPRPLAAATVVLDRRGDHANAMQARLVAARRLLLLGRIEDARGLLATIDPRGAGPTLAAVAALAEAEVALRSIRPSAARAALDRAQSFAARAGVPALVVETDEARAALERPAARRFRADGDAPLRMDAVETLFASDALVVDACRRGLRHRDTWRPLARRPILFALLRRLAEAWPDDADRNALIADAFRTRRPDETHRARLRVEIGRLRGLVTPMARIEATPRGFALVPRDERDVVLLLPPIEGEGAALVALLADGAAWSTSAVALALGASQRTVQRALAGLEAGGQVRAIGRARARRWLAPPLAGFTTLLLLPATMAPG
jgi:hypothetical protein